jgi:hypothetical protein
VPAKILGGRHRPVVHCRPILFPPRGDVVAHVFVVTVTVVVVVAVNGTTTEGGGADEQLPLTSLSSLTQASCLSKMRHHRDIFPTNTMAYDTIVRQSRATMKERNRAQAAEKASAKRKITMSIQVKYLEKRGRSVWPKGPHLVRIFKMKSHLIQ